MRVQGCRVNKGERGALLKCYVALQERSQTDVRGGHLVVVSETQARMGRSQELSQETMSSIQWAENQLRRSYWASVLKIEGFTYVVRLHHPCLGEVI